MLYFGPNFSDNLVYYGTVHVYNHLVLLIIVGYTTKVYLGVTVERDRHTM